MPAFCRRLPSPRYIWTFPLCTPFSILYQFQASLLRQHGIKNPQWYANKMQELIDEGHEMDEFVQPVVKAIAGSGILGKEVYYAIFPEEDPGKDQAKGKTKPKN